MAPMAFNLVIFGSLITLSQQGQFEKQLYKELLESYQPLARPVLNESEPVEVSLGLSLQQLVDIDEKNQIIILNVWLNYKWSDPNFIWDAADYGGVKELRIPPSDIWRPDVLLYNSADETFDSTYQSNVVVKNDGSMEWIPPGIVKGTCKLDIRWFPFDDQHCDLKFGSWSFSGFMLNLSAGEFNKATYTENGEWDLISVEPHRNVFKYDCCPDPYLDVTFKIHVRRRTLYYGFNLIIPCLLISFMTLLDFTLPPDSGEKLSLGVTIFMSLCVFLLMIAEALPPTSDAVPLIGIYFSSIMIVVSASVVFTVLVLNIHHRNPTTHEMGDWTRAIFLNWLPWLLMMSRPGFKCTRGKFAIRTESLDTISMLASKSLLANILDLNGAAPAAVKGHHVPNGNSNPQPPQYNNISTGHKVFPTRDYRECLNEAEEIQMGIVGRLEPLLQGIYVELKCITKKVKDDQEEEDVMKDWIFAAMVVDRLSLIIFTAVLLISTGAILFSAPHIF